MFAGHVGAALAISQAEKRSNVGVFVLAALLLDVVLWLLILAGYESVTIPAAFVHTHQPEFVFPYSHGLVASLCWSFLAGALAYAACPLPRAAQLRKAGLVAAAVFSHWVLDVLVHVPELPLLGAASPRLGLGLWNHLPLALAVEALLVIGGVWLFWAGSGVSKARKAILAGLTLLLLAFTIAGMTIAPAPPSATVMAASSLLTILVVCGLFAWLGRGAPESST